MVREAANKPKGKEDQKDLEDEGEDEDNLEDDVAKPVIAEVAAVEEAEVEGVVGLPGDGEADVQPLLDLADLLVGGAGEEVLEEELVLGDPGEWG